jgi:hypothetical protein
MVARNAFADLATEETLAAVRDALGPQATEETVASIAATLTAVQNPTGTALTVSGTRDKFRDGFTTGSTAQPVDPAVWTLVNEAPDTGNGRGHLVLPGGDAQGSAYLRVSLSPFTAGSSVHLVSKESFTIPIRHAWGVSMSQRIVGQEVLFGLAEADPGATDTLGLNRLPQPADLPISGTISVTSNIGTVTVPNHGLKGNDRVLLVGNTRKELDVGPVYVTVVDANTITVPIVLANAAYPAGGVVRTIDPTGLVANAALQLWGDSATVTNASYVGRRNGAKYRVLTGAGTITSTPVQNNTSPYTDAWIAAGVSEIWANLDEVTWRSWSDGVAGMAGYNKMQQSIPDETRSYRLYARAKTQDNVSRPIARVVSAVKAASATATITTDVPHGLVVNDTVSVTGVRDQANFANVGGSVLTVPTATTFTMTMGGASTATDTSGGVVWLNRGGVQAPGFGPQPVQSISRANGVLSVNCTSAPTIASPGDYVNLHGMNGVNGALVAANYEGAYKVLRITGSTMELAAPGPDFATFNTGGTIIKRTDVRMHFARILSHTRLMTEVVGGRASTTDQNNAVPVSITVAPTLNVNATLLPVVNEGAPLTTTALLAGASYSQTALDTGAGSSSRQTMVRVIVQHVAANTGPGSLVLEESTDNATFRETRRVPVPHEIDSTRFRVFDLPLTLRYWRLKFTNGGTAQTAFYLGYASFRGQSPQLDRTVLPFVFANGTQVAAGATFNSAIIDLGVQHNWDVARVLIQSDQSSAPSGIAIQQSPDNANWFQTTTSALTVASAGSVSTAPPLEDRIVSRYIRVLFVNGAAISGATAFRMTLTLVPR